MGEAGKPLRFNKGREAFRLLSIKASTGFFLEKPRSECRETSEIYTGFLPATGLVMKSQTVTHSKMADQVRAFYDKHPYPPPVNSLGDYRRRWENEGRRRADFHLFFPDRAYQADQAILVAGCGTSQAAKYALRQPEAQVVGIDVSQTSIQQTAALRRKYKLDNLELRQLPLERATELERSFDKIICTGVLHHLPNPDAGLSALHQVLKPDGAMHLMVYATYGRSGIYMLQEYARRLELGHTDQDINNFAAALMALPLDHPLARLLGESPDFQRKDALADALLNPMDRAYTVPQLLDFLERCGLTFGRWVRQAPYLPQCGALATTPHSARLNQLPRREQYAAVELFRGTMLRHSLVAYHADGSAHSESIQFDDDDWPNYKPIRLPETIRVTQKLPPGAAAVLINRSHTYPDLYLPVDALQKKLYDAIDGHRTVGEIIGGLAEVERGQQTDLRRFFQTLWQYDQIVFGSGRVGEASVK